MIYTAPTDVILVIDPNAFTIRDSSELFILSPLNLLTPATVRTIRITPCRCMDVGIIVLKNVQVGLKGMRRGLLIKH